MFRTGKILSFIVGVIGSMVVSKSDHVHQWGTEMWARIQEQDRINDSIERAAVADRMRAQATVRETQEQPIKNLQNQIDAIHDQIMGARSKGLDVRSLEAVQDRLEEDKAALEKQL